MVVEIKAICDKCSKEKILKMDFNELSRSIEPFFYCRKPKKWFCSHSRTFCKECAKEVEEGLKKVLNNTHKRN